MADIASIAAQMTTMATQLTALATEVAKLAPPPVIPPVVNPPSTTITAPGVGQSMTDAKGHVFKFGAAISGGDYAILRDDKSIGQGILLALVNGIVWENTASWGWFSFDPATGAGVFQPKPPPTGTVTPPVTPPIVPPVVIPPVVNPSTGAVTISKIASPEYPANRPAYNVQMAATKGVGTVIQVQEQLAGGNWTNLVTNTSNTLNAAQNTFEKVVNPQKVLISGKYEARAIVDNVASNVIAFTV